MLEYHVEQMWAGWFGGFGSSGAIQERLNDLAARGWRLTCTEVDLRLWLWLILRPRLMLLCERTGQASE